MDVISELSYSGSLDLDGFTSQWYNTENINFLRLTMTASQTSSVGCSHSLDGITQIYDDLLGEAVGVSGSTFSVACKAKYIKVYAYANTTPGTTKLITLGSDEPMSSADIKNIGSGLQIYNPSLSALRTITSADTSILITQNAETINFQSSYTYNTNVITDSGLGTSLYSNGFAPTFVLKTLFAGDGINLIDGPSDITIKNSAEILNVGVGTINLMKDGTLASGNYEIHRLQAGTNITLGYDPSDGIIISAASGGATTSLGTVGNLSSVNLVNDGIGPTLALKEIVPSTNIVMTQDTTSIYVSTVPITKYAFGLSITAGANSNIYFTNSTSNTNRICQWRVNKNMKLSGLSISPATNYSPTASSITSGSIDFSLYSFPDATNPTSLGSESYYSPNPFYSIPYTAINSSSLRYSNFYTDSLNIDVVQGDIIGVKMANNLSPASSLSEMLITLYFN